MLILYLFFFLNAYFFIFNKQIKHTYTHFSNCLTLGFNVDAWLRAESVVFKPLTQALLQIKPTEIAYS